MSAMPDVCPICSSPVAPTPSEAAPAVTLEAPAPVDLRDTAPADSLVDDAPVDDAPVDDDQDVRAVADEIDLSTTREAGARRSTATPTRTRPKTPLRPYVPPAAATQQAPNPFATPKAASSGPTALPRRAPQPSQQTAQPAPRPPQPPAWANHAPQTPDLPPPMGRPIPSDPTGPTASPAAAPSPPAVPPAAQPPPAAAPSTPAAPPAAPLPPVPPSATPAAPPVPPSVPASATPALPPRPPLSQRPDPYAQISNPLHTAWGQAPPAPVVHHMPAPTPVKHRRGSKWLGRLARLLVLALLAGGIWWQRDWIGDQVDSLYERINGDDTAAMVHDPANTSATAGVNPFTAE